MSFFFFSYSYCCNNLFCILLCIFSFLFVFFKHNLSFFFFQTCLFFLIFLQTYADIFWIYFHPQTMPCIDNKPFFSHEPKIYSIIIFSYSSNTKLILIRAHRFLCHIIAYFCFKSKVYPKKKPAVTSNTFTWAMLCSDHKSFLKPLFVFLKILSTFSFF